MLSGSIVFEIVERVGLKNVTQLKRELNSIDARLLRKKINLSFKGVASRIKELRTT